MQFFNHVIKLFFCSEQRLKGGRPIVFDRQIIRHYAPKSPLVLVTGDSERFAEHCNARRCAALCFDEDAALLDVPYFSYGGAEDFAAQARLLFAALRRLDGIAPEIAAHAPKAQGLGLAVYNRLLRATEFRIV
ncbi:MAG: hypothetical protein FWG82_03140 [Oscillospiraceae bacterium]|nr:hypothetical protein [Oscillospiraceae bacterium]